MRSSLIPSQPIYLAGPTAVGKSELAVELACRIQGEIVSVDAFQVYSGLPILTAQPDSKLLARVPHHLIGHISPEADYHIWRYQIEARQKIVDIFQRGKTPVIVGGSGLYFRALIQGLDPLPASSLPLRRELELLALDVLLERLHKIDPYAVARIDIHNRRRVLRAIEICELSGKSLKSFRTSSQKIFAIQALVLVRKREELYSRIVSRVHYMWEQGVAREIIRMQSQIGKTASQAIGLKEISAWIKGKLTKAECQNAICAATYRYAKRQLTWFKNQTTFVQLCLSQRERDTRVTVETIIMQLERLAMAHKSLRPDGQRHVS